jgi:hypothetical protein
MMAESPAGARIGSTYLGNYWQQRANAEQAYGQEVAQQNQFAYDQLAQNMAAEKMKALPELVGKPGGLQLASAIPYYAHEYGLDTGDPGTIGDIIQQQRAAGQAKTLQEAETGSYQGAQAGTPVDASTISGLTGLPARDATPLVLQNTAMKERNANMRAAASAGQERAPGYNVQVNPGPGMPPVSIAYGPKTTAGKGGLGAVLTDVRRQGSIPSDVPLSDVETRYLQGQGGNTSAQPSATVRPPAVQTNLPQAPQTQSQRNMGASTAANAMKNNEDWIAVNKGQNASAKDIDAARGPSGQLQSAGTSPDGRQKVVGASGKTYTMPY